MKIDTLLKHMLPSELFEYFDFIDIQESPDDTLTFYLNEKNIIPPEFTDRDIVSNGFDKPITIQDFPLRSHYNNLNSILNSSIIWDFISSIDMSLDNSFDRVVTPLSTNPQGLI